MSMKTKKIVPLITLFLLVSLVYAQDNTLTPQEKAEGWVLLFNGENFDGWSAPQGTAPDSVWKIEDGVFSLRAPDDGQQMDIIAPALYSDFDLTIDFKLTAGANSGIKYFFSRYDKGGWLGLEYQIIDNERHPDAHNENRRLGALYDMFVAKATDAKVGEWNRARIVSRGSMVTHFLNGKQVLRFDRASSDFEEARLRSKYRNAKPDFGSLSQGHILIQDHNDIVFFKNVKIKPL